MERRTWTLQMKTKTGWKYVAEEHATLEGSRWRFSDSHENAMLFVDKQRAEDAAMSSAKPYEYRAVALPCPCGYGRLYDGHACIS